MRVYRMLPGHGNKGGKMYSFLGGDDLHTGQRVVAPYRHWVSGKIHDTMWTIMQSNDADGQYGHKEIDRLADTKTKAGRDVQLRLIKGTNIMDLSGAGDYSSKAGWTRDSKQRYKAGLRNRLVNEPRAALSSATATRQRLMEE